MLAEISCVPLALSPENVTHTPQELHLCQYAYDTAFRTQGTPVDGNPTIANTSRVPPDSPGTPSRCPPSGSSMCFPPRASTRASSLEVCPLPGRPPCPHVTLRGQKALGLFFLGGWPLTNDWYYGGTKAQLPDLEMDLAEV